MQGIDEQICRGYTCGAYGVCIDLVGNGTGYESVKACTLRRVTMLAYPPTVLGLCLPYYDQNLL